MLDYFFRPINAAIPWQPKVKPKVNFFYWHYCPLLLFPLLFTFLRANAVAQSNGHLNPSCRILQFVFSNCQGEMTCGQCHGSTDPEITYNPSRCDCWLVLSGGSSASLPLHGYESCQFGVQAKINNDAVLVPSVWLHHLIAGKFNTNANICRSSIAAGNVSRGNSRPILHRLQSCIRKSSLDILAAVAAPSHIAVVASAAAVVTALATLFNGIWTVCTQDRKPGRKNLSWFYRSISFYNKKPLDSGASSVFLSASTTSIACPEHKHYSYADDHQWHCKRSHLGNSCPFCDRSRRNFLRCQKKRMIFQELVVVVFSL